MTCKSDARTAHWVMQSDQNNCPDNDSDSIALSGGQCSLDVQNSNSKADSGTCNSSVRTEQGSDVAHCYVKDYLLTMHWVRAPHSTP